MKRLTCNFALFGLLAFGAPGCGDGPPAPGPENTADSQARAKLEAFQKLVEGLSKDPNGMEAKGELENFRNYSIDVSKNRKEVEEIVELYRSRVKGKYKTEVATEVQMEMVPLENALKAK